MVEFIEMDGRHFARLGPNKTGKGALIERYESALYPGETAILFWEGDEETSFSEWEQRFLVTESRLKQALEGLQDKPPTPLPKE